MVEKTIGRATSRNPRSLTPDEEIVWAGNPSFFSLFPRYLSSTIILGLNLFWGNIGYLLENTSGDSVIREMILNASLENMDFEIAMVGLMVTGLVTIRLIYFNNGMLHGRVMLLWMLVSITSPFIYYMAVEYDLHNSFSGSPDHAPGLIFFSYNGLVFWVASVISTMIFQKSILYVLTDKRAHFDVRFLYLWSNLHTIDLLKIENVVVESTILGRLFGFGNLHLLTSSGIGTESASTSVGIVPSSKITTKKSLPKKILSILAIMLTRRRTRKRALPDPAGCFFGIRSPTKLHPLVNDSIDRLTGARAVD